MRLVYLFEDKEKETIEIYVKSANMTYSIPKSIWELAIGKFNEQYKGSNVVPIAKKIARELMPSNQEDPYREERLFKCLLSQKGKIGNKKKPKPKNKSKQQELF